MSGFEARAVYSGKAAVDALSSFEPDILISDVMMPEMTGIEAAIEIVGKCPNCKVLLFSGQAATVDMLQQARVQGYSLSSSLSPSIPRICSESYTLPNSAKCASQHANTGFVPPRNGLI